MAIDNRKPTVDEIIERQLAVRDANKPRRQIGAADLGERAQEAGILASCGEGVMHVKNILDAAQALRCAYSRGDVDVDVDMRDLARRVADVELRLCAAVNDLDRYLGPSS